MIREDVEAKGRRYLTEGRLTVGWVGVDGSIIATCLGAGEKYAVGYRRGGWYCECQALGRCSHLVALQLVTTRPAGAVS